MADPVFRSSNRCSSRGRRPAALALVTLLCWGQMLPAWAAPAQTPLLTRAANPATPNLVYTIDDSGSMSWRTMPDSTFSGISSYNFTHHPADSNGGYSTYPVTTRAADLISARLRSSAYNLVYYNPEIRYQPWAFSDNTSFPNAHPEAAWLDPTDRVAVGTATQRATAIADGKAVNLVGGFTYGKRIWCKSATSSSPNLTTASNNTSADCEEVTGEEFYPATYYVHNGGSFTNVSNFTRVRIADSTTFTRGPGRSDCAVTGATATCTRDQEYQNFANWFTYYRYRMLLAIGASSRAFAKQGDGFRVGYGRINKGATTIDGQSTGALVRGVRRFEGTSRTEFFNWLYQVEPTGNTPLRRAMDYVGQYYSRSDNPGPWGNTPGSNDPTDHIQCRKSYHILMTDGYWNSSEAGTSGANTNVDNASGPTITGPNSQSYTYSPVAPFKDSASKTLADVAMYYWNRDLRPNLENRVSPDSKNPAFWQHMVNFTVGLGLSGTLSYPSDLAALEAGTKSWPTVSGDTATTIDDLWHAAINSRGTYLSAKDPEEFSAALSSILQEIIERQANDGGVATAAATLQAGNRKYVPEYRTGSWTGNLRAYGLDALGQHTTLAWDAESKLPAHGSRNIYVGTRNGSPKAVEFKWASLSSALQSELGAGASSNLVNYLRGDDTYEGTTYRRRSARLGDFVNSQPVYVKGLVDMQYSLLPAGTPGRGTYDAFVSSKAGRNGVVFIGGNDGMLHAFRDTGTAAQQGTEVFGFIPRALLPTLNLLSSPTYGHRYYVDGPLVETDAYWGGTWRNLLVGSTGAGARAVFALDVTDTSAMGAGNVLWELDASVDAEIGHILSPIEVGLMKDGTWAAVFGNGYDSASGKAQLFVVNAQTGAVIRKIDTGVGSGNGLGGVKLVRDENRVVVGAYAGDLKGNVWKFDLDASTASGWEVAFGGQPLYTAKFSGTPQPITGTPDYMPHPKGGYMVLVGSGKLFEEGDQIDTSRQTLYGLWDQQTLVKSGTGYVWTVEPRITDPASVVSNTFNATTVSGPEGQTFYQVTTTPLDWSIHRGWSLGQTLAAGQRNIFEVSTVMGLALFQTVAPTTTSSNPCLETSGEGFNIMVDAITGAMAPPMMDTNGDGVVNHLDVPIAGYKSGADGRDVTLYQPPGAPSIPVADGGCGPGRKLVSMQGAGSGSGVMLCATLLRPRIWRQIFTLPQ